MRRLSSSRSVELQVHESVKKINYFRVAHIDSQNEFTQLRNESIFNEKTIRNQRDKLGSS